MLVFLLQDARHVTFFGRASRTLFVSISEASFQLTGINIRGFRIESIAKTNFSPKAFFVNFEIEFCGFLGGLGNHFSGFSVS